jgi:hypothetical protein
MAINDRISEDPCFSAEQYMLGTKRVGCGRTPRAGFSWLPMAADGCRWLPKTTELLATSLASVNAGDERRVYMYVMSLRCALMLCYTVHLFNIHLLDLLFIQHVILP